MRSRELTNRRKCNAACIILSSECPVTSDALRFVHPGSAGSFKRTAENGGCGQAIGIIVAHDEDWPAYQQAKRESDAVAAVEKLSLALYALLRAEEQDRRRDQEAGAMAAAAPKL